MQVPRGTFDILPESALARAGVEALARELFEAAGYARIETPTFESTELFVRTVGEATDVVRKEMYTFDDGGGRSLTLRPEGTAPICRAYLEHGMHRLPAPVKLWYNSSFYRRERAQAGRYRQFWQIGAEAIGSDDPALDAEAILLLNDLLAAVGVKDVRLRLASLGSGDAREAYRAELQNYLNAHIDQLSRDVRERIELNPLRAFDSSDPGTQAVMAKAPHLIDWLSEEDAKHFAKVRSLLDELDIDYEIDPTLVRGLDYYTRTLFEFTSDSLGAQSGVGGGGRYDGLIEEIGGKQTPAVGWAAGIERMLLAAQSQPSQSSRKVDLYVAYTNPNVQDQAFLLSVAARQAGLGAQAELAGRGLKGQLKQGDRLGARYVALVEEDGEHVTLKEMASGQQRKVKRSEVIDEVKT